MLKMNLLRKVDEFGSWMLELQVLGRGDSKELEGVDMIARGQNTPQDAFDCYIIEQ